MVDSHLSKSRHMEQSYKGETIMLCATTLSENGMQIQALTEWQVDTLMGDSMSHSCYPATEIEPTEFITQEGGLEAAEKELMEMKERRFNTTKPIPDRIKHTALECRIICTRKRCGKMKARLVANLGPEGSSQAPRNLDLRSCTCNV